MSMVQSDKDALVAKIQSADVAVLGEALDQAFDAGVASVPPSGGLSQADVDAAVAAAHEAFKAQLSALLASL